MSNIGISIIIPTIRKEVLTLESIKHCPVNYHLILSKGKGLGLARNLGAVRGRYDLLVFLDDDVILDEKIWKILLDTKKGFFRMLKVGKIPCTRVMAINRCDFEQVDGFNEKIRYIGEDFDFYHRAIVKGLKFLEVPLEYVYHKPHIIRIKNKHTALGIFSERARLLLTYKREFSDFKTFFLQPLKYKTLRAVAGATFWTIIRSLMFYKWILTDGGYY